MEQILIVEDDPHINNLICTALGNCGYRTVPAFSGTEAELNCQSEVWDLVVLDLMLPGKSGNDVLELIRSRGATPVIVLTAFSDKENKLAMFQRGADDYITKPFDIDELIARVAAVLRRSSEPVKASEESLRFGEIEILLEQRKVTVSGHVLDLTQIEFELLKLFISYPGKVFSRENIFKSVWGEDHWGEVKTIDVHISNIRKKMSALSSSLKIQNVWGIGYRICG